MMQLLYTNPLPSPEFVSLSLVLQPDPNDPNGGGMGEPLLLASPLTTISHGVATAALKELHKYLSALSGLLLLEGKEVSIHDQIVAELMQDDDGLVVNDNSSSNTNKLQVFRPRTAHGMGLHYCLLKEEKAKTDFASLVLAASRSSTKGSVGDSENESRKIEKSLLGVLVCVGLSGIPYAHSSSSLQYSLSQRVNDCVGVLSKRIAVVDVASAKTILSTLLATEDEVRKTNDVAESAISTSIPESGENLLGTSKKASSAFKSLVMMNKGGSGGTNIHVAVRSTSNDLSRILIERLNVLSVAEGDSLLRPYETSGQQRKANLDLTGTKSRFRKRKTDSTTNADLDNFDYRGPARERNLHNRFLLRQQQSSLASSAPGALQSFAPRSALTLGASSTSRTVVSKSQIRQHKSDVQGARRIAVPTLSAPKGDVSSSRRSSSSALSRPVSNLLRNVKLLACLELHHMHSHQCPRMSTGTTMHVVDGPGRVLEVVAEGQLTL
jgi:hypothetical protein